jgi:protein AFG1
MADSLEVVAEEIAKESILLCIDKYMVTDVADALILTGFLTIFSKRVL